MSRDKRNRPQTAPPELITLLQNLEVEERAKVQALFETALDAARERKINDLWGRPEFASSFWILLISGLDDDEGVEIAEAVLKWKAFIVKDSASVECVQAAERESFQCCTRAFQVVGFPSLVVGCSPEMKQFVRVGPQLLGLMRSGKGIFHRFLTALHSSIEQTSSLADLRSVFAADAFWIELHLPPTEAKKQVFVSPDPVRQYDVFLSHNSQDKPIVQELAKALQQRGIRVWLDDWELVPGRRPWQDALAHIIETTRTAMVLVGKHGIGPWEKPEMRGCISQFVERQMPVIPVLLPGLENAPELPLLLRDFTWVDLRSGLDENALTKLEWGIKGRLK